jgi:hypothetical protein
MMHTHALQITARAVRHTACRESGLPWQVGWVSTNAAFHPNIEAGYVVLQEGISSNVKELGYGK